VSAGCRSSRELEAFAVESAALLSLPMLLLLLLLLSSHTAAAVLLDAAAVS
jgi:hypothetical protein